MSQQIQCPHCGQAYALTDEQAPQYAGQTITCTRCQKPFTVALTGPAAAPSAPPPMRPTTPTPSAPFPPMQQGAPVGYAQGGYANVPTTSGLAIGALICGLAGIIVPFLGLVGLLLGLFALGQTRSPNVSGRGMAIGGIVSGILTTLLWGSCVGMVFVRARQFPMAFQNAIQASNRVKCASNLRQIGQAILLYSNDNNGSYPPTLDVLLTTEDITPEVFNCPSTKDTPAPGTTAQQQAPNLSKPGHLSYVYVGAAMDNKTVNQNAVVAYEPLTNHNDGANFLWGDGHVSFVNKTQAQNILDQLKAGKNPPKLTDGSAP